MRGTSKSSRTLKRLAALPGVGQLPLHTRQAIDRLSYEVQVGEGEFLIRQGQIGRQAFIIAEGIVEVLDCGQVIATRAAGDLVGEAAVLHGRVREADVVARTDLTLLVMSSAELITLYDDPAFRAWAGSPISARTVTYVTGDSHCVAGVGFEPT